MPETLERATPGTLIPAGALITPGGQPGPPGIGLNFRGSIATQGDLPTTGQQNGDVWIIEDTGEGFVWDAATGSWESMGTIRGVNGKNAYTDTIATFTVPAVGSTATLTVVDSDWIAVGQFVWLAGAGAGGDAGALKVTGISGNTVTLLNPESGVLSPSGDANNLLSIGSDGLLYLAPIDVARKLISADEGNISTIGSDGLIYTPGTKKLELDLDLYVPLTHPNAPSSEVTFANISDALAHAANYTAATNAFINIHVAAGVYQLTSPIVINQFNSSQIKIIGADPVVQNVTSANQTGGSAGAYLGNLGVANISAFDAGSFVLMIEGSWHIFSGVGLVQYANPGIITVQFPRRSLPAGPYAAGGWVARMYTVIDCPVDDAGIVVQTGIGLLENIIIDGSRQTTGNYGLRLTGGTTTLGDYVGVYGCHTAGVILDGYEASLFGRLFCSGNRGIGLCPIFYTRVGLADASVFTGNDGNGLQVHRGLFSAEYAVASGNQSNGVWAPGATLNLSYLVAQDNLVNGLQVTATGTCYALNSNTLRNGNIDVDARGIAFINLDAPIAAGNTSPPRGTVGNNNSFIT